METMRVAKDVSNGTVYLGDDIDPIMFDVTGLDDLPCPWCHASTSETDDRCPSCDQRFGG